MKKISILLLSISLIVCSLFSTYAGWLQLQGTANWFYSEGNILIANGWKAINGNWYYFGADGHMYVNTYTPDGYYVDSNGIWNGTTGSTTQSSYIISSSGSSSSSSSKYLYKCSPTLSGCSLVSGSITLNSNTYSNNVYKFTSDGGSLSLTAPGKYTSLSFKYLVKNPNEDNEYNLQIYVNGNLEDEIDEVDNTAQTYDLDFEVGDTIKLVWNFTKDGSSAATSTYLYLMDGKFSK